MSFDRGRSRALLLAAACLGAGSASLVACGGEAPEPKAPTAAPEAPAQPGTGAMDVDGSLAEIERAEAELDRAFGRKSDRAIEKKSADEPTELSGTDATPCANACRALGSMQRATTHLCELTGDSDPRCDGAKTRLASASERVRGSCPACP